jgi:hypothetical protein
MNAIDLINQQIQQLMAARAWCEEHAELCKNYSAGFSDCAVSIFLHCKEFSQEQELLRMIGGRWTNNTSPPTPHYEQRRGGYRITVFKAEQVPQELVFSEQ